MILCTLVTRTAIILAFTVAVGSAGAQDSKTPAAGRTQAEAKRSGDQPKTKAVAAAAVATVNGEPILKSELVNWLGRFEIEPDGQQRAYDAAMEVLVDGKLLEQFMKKMRVPLAKTDVDGYINQFRQSLQQDGSSLENYLAMTATTEDQFMKMASTAAQWKNYVLGQATDAALEKYLKDNMDVFGRTEVKASHILIKVDPKATAADKEAAKQKLLVIKKEIADGKISFADAANKYSEDDGNKAQPSGGNLGYFPRKGVFIEAFSKAAFAMKEGDISEPVETEYGWHLILLNQRKPGEKVVFSEELKPGIMSVFAEELQEKLIENERKNAKIEIQPIPADLLQLVQRQALNNAPSAEAPKSAAGETNKAATKAK
jgi:peptidyl-prolyl cis-trans isomerase C